uniref:Uncharacterized protein n=1 Tax=Anguilla anguilla TaxID=7936 RepID=A0A0E9TVU5_ANGAN
MRYWGLAGGQCSQYGWLLMTLQRTMEPCRSFQAVTALGSSHTSPSPRSGNMLSVNQEIPEELVKTDEAVLAHCWQGRCLCMMDC